MGVHGAWGRGAVVVEDGEGAVDLVDVVVSEAVDLAEISEQTFPVIDPMLVNVVAGDLFLGEPQMLFAQ